MHVWRIKKPIILAPETVSLSRWFLTHSTNVNTRCSLPIHCFPQLYLTVHDKTSSLTLLLIILEQLTSQNNCATTNRLHQPTIPEFPGRRRPVPSFPWLAVLLFAHNPSREHFGSPTVSVYLQLHTRSQKPALDSSDLLAVSRRSG